MLAAPQHIIMLCSRLDLPGGIERAVVNTANLFNREGNSVTLVVLDETMETFYPVDKGISVIQHSLSFGITPEGNVISRKIKLLSDVLKLRKIIKGLKPGIIISSEYPFTVAAVLAGGRNHARLLAWEHHHFSWIKKNRFWSFLCSQAYSRLHGIVCLNKIEEEHYKKIAPTYVIPNVVQNAKGSRSAGDSNTILSIGWLIPRKGIDLLLTAAKVVLAKHPDWKWKLIGKGEMKEQVLAFIKTEKLEDRFLLQDPGKSAINDEYLNVSLFVLSSRSEAFPMVLLEAMSFGVPCISFDCPSGPADIITNQMDGLLVEKENPAKLSEAISSLIVNKAERKRMGENAFQSVLRFSPEAIYQLWKEKIFT